MGPDVSFFQTEKRPGVGVAVVIERDGKFLLGKRIGTHGPGTWAFPGGKLDWFEDIETCAARETLEETGLRITDIHLGRYFTNDKFTEEGKHFVTLFVLGDCPEGEPQVLEPEKCESWGWFDWNSWPEPLFLPIRNALEQGFDPRS